MEKKQRNEAIISNAKPIDELPRQVLALCGTFLHLDEHQRLLVCNKATKSAMLLPHSFPPCLLIRKACRFVWGPTTKPMISARTVSLWLQSVDHRHGHGAMAARPDQPFNPVSTREAQRHLQAAMQEALFRSPRFQTLIIDTPSTCVMQPPTYLHEAVVLLHQQLCSTPVPATAALTLGSATSAGLVHRNGLADWKTVFIEDHGGSRIPDSVVELHIGPNAALWRKPMPESRANLRRLFIDFTESVFENMTPRATERMLQGFNLDELHVTLPDTTTATIYFDGWHRCIAADSAATSIRLDIDRKELCPGDAVESSIIEALRVLHRDRLKTQSLRLDIVDSHDNRRLDVLARNLELWLKSANPVSNKSWRVRFFNANTELIREFRSA